MHKQNPKHHKDLDESQESQESQEFNESNEEAYLEEYEDNVDGKLKAVKKDLKKCQQEKQEYLDGWQRAKADYINLKKRSEEEKKQIRNFSTEEILIELLPVLDNFEMAFKDQEAWNSAPENWRSGIEFIYNHLVKVVQNHGATQVDPLGEKFDPRVHHSIAAVPVTDKKQDGVILEVQQKGYLLKDKIIRPAMVKVGQLDESLGPLQDE